MADTFENTVSFATAAVTKQTETATELDNFQSEVALPPNVTDLEVSIEAQVLLTALDTIGSVQKKEDSSYAAYYGLLEQEKSIGCRVCLYRCSCSCTDKCISVVDLSPSTIKTQEIGSELLKQEVFPLFSTNGRELWTYVQFILVLGFALKCAVIDLAVNSPSNRTPVDFVLLAFTLIFLPFSILDVCITIYLHRCHLFCTPCRRHRATNKDETAAGNNSPSTSQKDCQSFRSLLKSKLKYDDLIRMILNEVIVYMIMICTMLQLILNVKKSGNDLQLVFSIISFIITILWKIGTVYSISAFVILRTIFRLRKIRKDGPVASSANCCHVHLIVHVLVQMVSQVAMIVCIAAKIHYENRNYSDDNIVQISGFLWYMFIGALIIPLAGVFTFGISNFYYIEEYPIGYFLDLLNSVITRRRNNKEQGSALSEEEMELSSEKSEKVVQGIAVDYKYIIDKFFLTKYYYVFLSPLMVISSLIHSLLIVGFLASCILGSDASLIILYHSSIGWTVFFAITALLVCAANILVILIAAAWIIIYIGILSVSFALVALILFIICLPCILIASIASGEGDAIDLDFGNCDLSGLACLCDCRYCEGSVLESRAEERRRRHNII